MIFYDNLEVCDILNIQTIFQCYEQPWKEMEDTLKFVVLFFTSVEH